MTTIPTQCSQKVSETGRWGAFHPHPCKHKATVTRGGKAYCGTHDPERRAARAAAKCFYLGDDGRQCGRPAVALKYGSGRCALHTQEALDAAKRLQRAAPALLEKLQHLVRLLEPLEQAGGMDVPGLATLNGARAAIAQAKGKE